MDNCTQWSSVFTTVLRFKNVNAHLRCVDAQEDRASAGGIDGTTGCG